MSDLKEFKQTLTEFISADLRQIAKGPVRFSHPITVFNGRSIRRDAQYGAIIKMDDPVEDYPHGTVETRAFDFIGKASGWLPANPNNPEVVRKTEHTYLPFYFSEGNNLGKVANLAGADGTFEFEKTLRTKQYILLSGVRGVGKTSFMNFLLNSRTKALEEENIWWFRIDATKVHDLWKLMPSIDVTDLYYNYYVLHAIYVMCVYGGAFNGRGSGPLNVPHKSTEFEKVISFLRNTNHDVLTSVVDKFEEHAKLLRLNKSSDVSVDIIGSIIKKRKKNRFGIFFSFAEKIVPFLEENDIDFLAMVDGLDNIAWTKKNKFFLRSCSNFSIITTKIVGAFGGEHRLLLAARPETTNEIITSSSHTKGQGFNWSLDDTRIELWRIVPPSASGILEKKVIAARNPAVFRDERAYVATDNLEVKQLDALLHEFLNDAKRYPEILCWALRQSLKKAENDGSFINDASMVGSITEANLLSIVFDSDLRAYIDNVTKVYFLKKKLKLDRPEVTLELLRSRILQYVFLNGSAFIDSHTSYLELEGNRSRSNYDDRGAVFPNLFWWPQDKTTNCPDLWHGLMGYRFLQMASSLDKFCLHDVMLCLNRLFGYSPDAICEMAEAFVAYGLIDIDPKQTKPVLRVPEKENPFFIYKNATHITQKGRLLRCIVFTRPELLYFYALDTPMHQQLVYFDTRFVRNYLEFGSLRIDEDFFRASVPTVATFLLHLCHFDKIEQGKLLLAKNEWPEIIEFLGGLSAVQGIFKMPANALDNFLSWAEIGANPTQNRDKLIASEVFKDVIGVIGGRMKLAKKDGVPRN